MVFLPSLVVDAGCQLGYVSGRLNRGLFTGRQCSKRVRTETSRPLEPWDWKSCTQYHFCCVLTVKVNHKASLIQVPFEGNRKICGHLKSHAMNLTHFISPLMVILYLIKFWHDALIWWILITENLTFEMYLTVIIHVWWQLVIWEGIWSFVNL